MSSSILMKGIPFDSQESYNSHTGETTYDRVAYSADVADWFDTMFSTGIVIPGGGTFTTELKVESQSGMNVRINPGRAIINGRLGYIESAQVLTLDNPSTSNRIDRIVVELNLTERNFYIKVLKGTPSSSPVAVSPTKTDTIYQLVLADVTIPANTSNTSNITDQRNNTELCGISNVKIGVYIPSASSGENIGVSEDISDEFGGATNVEDALNNIYQVGDIKTTIRNDLSDKWLKCSGDLLSVSQYPDYAKKSSNFISCMEFTATAPEDIIWNQDNSNNIPTSSTFISILDVCLYGTSGVCFVALFKGSITGNSIYYAILFYTPNINNITSSNLNDLNYVQRAFYISSTSTVGSTPDSNASGLIRMVHVNNRFVVFKAYKSRTNNDTGNGGYVYNVSGSSLSKSTNFLTSRIQLNMDDVTDSRAGIFVYDIGYNNGTYKFLFSLCPQNYPLKPINNIYCANMSSLSSSTNTIYKCTSFVSGNRMSEMSCAKLINYNNTITKCLYFLNYDTNLDSVYFGLCGTDSNSSNNNISLSDSIGLQYVYWVVDFDKGNYTYCITFEEGTYCVFRTNGNTLEALTTSGFKTASNSLTYTHSSTAVTQAYLPFILNGKFYISGKELSNISELSDWSNVTNAPTAYVIDSSLDISTGYRELKHGIAVNNNLFIVLPSNSSKSLYDLSKYRKLPNISAEDANVNYYIKVKS